MFINIMTNLINGSIIIDEKNIMLHCNHNHRGQGQDKRTEEEEWEHKRRMKMLLIMATHLGTILLML